MNIFFASDLHLGHKSAVKWRSVFESIEEHDTHIIDVWNETVGKKDIVYLMGDISFRAERNYVLECLARLNGSEFRVVPGNHDDIPMLLSAPRVVLLPGLFKKYDYWLSHAPIHPNELRGGVNIHGHVHSASIPDPRYINVSMEAIGFVPLSLDEVRAIAEPKPSNYSSFAEYFGT